LLFYTARKRGKEERDWIETGEGLERF